PQPVIGVRRSPELLARWSELSAWGLILRTHEGNRPAESTQVYDTADTATAFAIQARVFAALADYRTKTVAHALRTGFPVLRHSFLTGQPTSDDQFFFGSAFLVAPVLTFGARTVRALLPAGVWTHLWSGSTFGDPRFPTEVTVPAPLGEPGVFHRADDTEAARLAAEVRAAVGGGG
ncbi:MAG: alpha-glucosidase, partial [Actinomycetota bacterium]|nr:alpha-glucosidase [Actinomycetota bacterium]